MLLGNTQDTRMAIQAEEVYRFKQLPRITGKSEETLKREMKAGIFPKGEKVSTAIRIWRWRSTTSRPSTSG